MEDITLRALRILREANVVFAEDTRVAAKLLARHEIQASVHRLDAETEVKVAHEVVERLERDERVAYISDAGTPGISDPGARLVAYVREHAPEAVIESIPGPSALTALISIAGIDMTRFTFLGFLPHKKGRQTALKEIALMTHPAVLYESPHRIIKLLQELATFAPEKSVTIGRELTKMHEEVLVGTPQEIITSLESRDAVRGEFVVIISKN